ncbi:MAG: hypothetical protein NTW87_09820 [Planctomycetota bacterium]|nr:hypothetical protein [Planctomycetota bacterium]
MADMKDIPDGTPPAFAYLLAKAENYLEVGSDAYRAGDAFKMPSAEWPQPLLEAVGRGMEQICRFRGLSRDEPFENLGVDGFYALLATLHFKCGKQMLVGERGADFLDAMYMQHRMTGQQIVLYNLVPKPALPSPGTD